MEIFGVLILTLCFGDVFSSNNNQTQRVDVKQFCEKTCSNPNWEFSFQENASVCLCWVDDSVDDVDANAMQKQATTQGYTLWVIRSHKVKTRRDTDETSSIEAVKRSEFIVTLPPLVKPYFPEEDDSSHVVTHEIKTRLSDDEEKIPKSPTLKKYKSSIDDKSDLEKSKNDPIVGGTPKGIIERLTPNRQRPASPSRSCSPETLKLTLQNIKLHINRLLERVDQPHLNCVLLISELETVKNSIQQLIARSSEKRDHERSRLLDQIRGREKERHAKFQSRLGHFDLPKRPSKLNLVGSPQNNEKNANKSGKDEKPTIITQPKELIGERR